MLGQTRGHAPESINRLLDHAKRALDQGLPERPVVNKIKEGLAKGAPPERIRPVIRDMVDRLRKARDMLREMAPERSRKSSPEGSRATEVMAEALGRGVTIDEIRSLNRSRGKGAVSREALAFGAKGLALTKEGGLKAPETLPVVGEAIRQGFRANELLDLGREMKKRGKEFRTDRNRLRDLKRAVERGERAEKIFERDRRSNSGRGRGGERLSREDRDTSKNPDHDRTRRDDRSGKGRGRDRIESRERIDRGRDSRGSSDAQRDSRDRGRNSSGRGRGGRDD